MVRLKSIRKKLKNKNFKHIESIGIKASQIMKRNLSNS